ncbi:kelch-like protein 8 [Tripterygium wilfordii]|uniref:Kelch-like protein 8 n=1 Tax=Tripterygium wilfordii TaxID=458696 RepID=A0A7J7C4S5_TRIWF|nr:kelch-like protein 8 [Tripterygium wilfordii]
MGSLLSLPRPTAPPPSPESAPLQYRVYASFCLREPSPNMNISNWIEFYNPTNNRWTPITWIPGLIDNHLLKDFVMLSLGSSIYIIGGRLCRKQKLHDSDDSDYFIDEELEVLSSVWRYNVYDSSLVVGGFVERGDSGWMPFVMERSSAEVYDTKTGRWGLVAGMWQLDVPPNQIVAVGERLFSSDDCLNAWKGHIEAYDDKVNIWNGVDGSHLQT